jgi:tetratricopeptide (TPR) repeat protein
MLASQKWQHCRPIVAVWRRGESVSVKTSIRDLIGLTLLSTALFVAPMGSAAAQSGFGFRTPSPTGNYLAGVAALDSLRAELAAGYLSEAARADRGNTLLSGRAFLAYLVAGDIARAEPMAQQILEADSTDELARLVLSSVALKQRRYNSVIQTLQPVSDGSLIGVTAGIMRAWAQVGNSEIDAAFTTMDRVGAGGFEEFLIFHRAIMADLGGRRAAAIDLSREAYEMDPFVTRIAEAHARILANAGQFEEAKAIVESFDAEGVVHPLIEAIRAPIEANQRPGLFAPNVQSGAAEMFHGLGTALARDGSRELGMVFLQLARYLDPQSGVVAMTLGDFLSNSGRYAEANAVYEDLPASSPLKPSAMTRMAENLNNKGDADGAIAQLREIVADRPDDVEALGVLGDILRYEERWEESAEVYTDLIAAIDGDRPRDWRYYYVRGIAYERAGMWDQAEPDFQRALELNPEQPQVLNYLGYSWVDQGINLEPALDMIERAVELQPRDGYIIDSLGWAFYRLGRIEEAVVELERAVRILPNDPEINDHLGDAYWRAGREREAVFQWRIATAVDDRGNVAERAAPKLLNGLDLDAPIED